MIETIALIFSILGAVFIGRHETRIFGFIFWIGGNLAWISYSILYPDIHIFILFFVYLISNVIGIHDTWKYRHEACSFLVNIYSRLKSKLNHG